MSWTNGMLGKECQTASEKSADKVIAMKGMALEVMERHFMMQLLLFHTQRCHNRSLVSFFSVELLHHRYNASSIMKPPL